jgi:hypothetical protein
VTDKDKQTQIRSGNTFKQVALEFTLNVTDGTIQEQTYAVLVTLNVTDGTIQEQTCRTINITFSQYAMQCNAMQYNTMQCNAMQYNAIQCNTMQYNAMQCNVCTKSVRPYGMKSVSHFFFFFFIFFKNKNDKILLKTRFRTQDLSLKWKSDTDGRT